MIKLAPSILSADFSQLGHQIKTIETAGAHFLHIDVMDGHFVPNISLGVPVIKSIRDITDMTFDVHLMIENPEQYIESFAMAGADIINFHVEAAKDIEANIRNIKSLNKRAALTIKPNTPVEELYKYLDSIDMVLVMSVEPGFGGQELIPHTLKKVEDLANYITNNNLLVDIEIDGGVKLSNVRSVIDAGANIIVAGSSVFNANDITESVREFYSVFSENGENK